MQNLGMAISYCALLLAGIVLFRGFVTRSINQFPLFYSYIVYAFCGSVVMYLVYWLDRPAYPSVYWIYFLISILVEFSVLVEISDHIFKNLPALRLLGRAVTVVISLGLALIYILPVILWSSGRRPALLGFALRASITKITVLAALFIVARYYASALGKPVAGLMLGFSIYLGVNVANLAASMTYAPGQYKQFLWVMTPAAYTLCLFVWTISLWNLAPEPSGDMISPFGGRSSKDTALELARLNNELSKLLEK
jgi:hypothetical protein